MDEKKKAQTASEYVSFILEFVKETDRAAVILGAARIDLVLYQLLIKFLLSNPTSTDDLFDGDGPLSSLSAKINLSFRLGLIDSDLTRALHIIRKIRNSFAHETSGCKLDSGAHKDRVRELILPLENKTEFGVIKENVFVLRQETTDSSADFRAALTLIVARLDRIIKKVGRLLPPENPQELIPWEQQDVPNIEPPSIKHD